MQNAKPTIVLTQEFVDSASPPLKGERWVADGRVKGFGLRLWSGKKGGSKAFAIRVTDRSGGVVRKVFDSSQSSAFWRSSRRNMPEFQLGECLSEARAWARDEIARLRGRWTLAERRDFRWQIRLAISEHQTLNGAADDLMRDMEKRHLSQTYIISVGKLFSKHFRNSIGETLLVDIDPKEIAKILVDRSIPAGNIRTLKAFLNQTFKWAGASFETKVEEINEAFWKRWAAEYDVKHPELRDLRPQDFEKIFSALDSEQTFWRQALCIRLFFKFGAPLSRVMAAEWAQIVREHWYPYYPVEKKLWFESREPLDQEAFRILDNVASRLPREQAESIYLFPSKYRRQVEHIRSVDTVWRNTLHDLRFRHYSLWEFAKSYRNPNNPSELGFFMRYYGPSIRLELKADAIATTLRQRRRTKLNSRNYK